MIERSVKQKQVEVLVLPDGRVDTKNASAFIGLSEKTLAMMRSRGTGPKYVKRGRVFYYLDELTAWVSAGEAQSTSESRLR